MATGDAALAAGMEILTGTEPARTLDEEVNKTRDYIADRTSAVTPVAKGGTGATTPAAARAALGVPSTTDLAGKANTSHTHTREQVTGLRQDLDYLGNRAVMAEEAKNGVLNAGVYSRGTVGQWRGLAVQADGVLAHTASAARFKENITPLDVTDEQVHALELVEFDWIGSGFHDVGMIADAVEDAGLSHFVFRDDDGQVLGIHYERVGLALLPVVQRLLARVAALEARDDA